MDDANRGRPRRLTNEICGQMITVNRAIVRTAGVRGQLRNYKLFDPLLDLPAVLPATVTHKRRSISIEMVIDLAGQSDHLSGPLTLP